MTWSPRQVCLAQWDFRCHQMPSDVIRCHLQESGFDFLAMAMERNRSLTAVQYRVHSGWAAPRRGHEVTRFKTFYEMCWEAQYREGIWCGSMSCAPWSLVFHSFPIADTNLEVINLAYLVYHHGARSGNITVCMSRWGPEADTSEHVRVLEVRVGKMSVFNHRLNSYYSWQLGLMSETAARSFRFMSAFHIFRGFFDFLLSPSHSGGPIRQNGGGQWTEFCLLARNLKSGSHMLQWLEMFEVPCQEKCWWLETAYRCTGRHGNIIVSDTSNEHHSACCFEVHHVESVPRERVDMLVDINEKTIADIHQPLWPIDRPPIVTLTHWPIDHG